MDKKYIRREGWIPSKTSLVCSDHFKESCMDRTGQIVRLRSDAVPTRFKKFPEYLKMVSYNIHVNYFRLHNK